MTELKQYIAGHILPYYNNFDRGHGPSHAEHVIRESMLLVEDLINTSPHRLTFAPDSSATAPYGSPVAPDSSYAACGSTITPHRASVSACDNIITPHRARLLSYTIAAYHDIGLCVDRENHHINSGKMLQEDMNLRKWFTEEEIVLMREAVEDHRASSKHAPRSIFGCIVAEADRDIDPDTILRRTIQFGLKRNPEWDFETHFQRALQHMHEKYAEGGYIKLWLNSKRNADGLRALREIINNEELLREKCYEHWLNETT